MNQLDLGGRETGAYDIAVDTVQAGPGDTVLVMDEGRRKQGAQLASIAEGQREYNPDRRLSNDERVHWKPLIVPPW